MVRSARLNQTLLTESCTVYIVRSAKLNQTLLTESCTVVRSAKLNQTLLTNSCTVVRSARLNQTLLTESCKDTLRMYMYVYMSACMSVVVDRFYIALFSAS